MIHQPVRVTVHAAGITLSFAELGRSEVIFQGQGKFAQVPDNCGRGTEGLLDFGICGSIQPQLFNIGQIGRCAKLLHITQHTHYLKLLAVLEAHERSPVLHGRIGILVIHVVDACKAVTGQQVELLAALGKNALGLQLEQTVGVLEEHKGRDGGKNAAGLVFTHIHIVSANKGLRAGIIMSYKANRSGVYDIHSPRVPSVEEIVNALSKMREKIEDKKLWVNPDCGLKTRGDKETKASLINMVQAAKILRDKA